MQWRQYSKCVPQIQLMHWLEKLAWSSGINSDHDAVGSEQQAAVGEQRTRASTKLFS